MKVRSSYGEGTFHGTKKKDAQSHAARATETPGTCIGPGGRTRADRDDTRTCSAAHPRALHVGRRRERRQRSKLLSRHGASLVPIFGPTEERVMARLAAQSQARRRRWRTLGLLPGRCAGRAARTSCATSSPRNELIEAAYSSRRWRSRDQRDGGRPGRAAAGDAGLHARQIYLDPAPSGIDARWAWTRPAGAAQASASSTSKAQWRFTPRGPDCRTRAASSAARRSHDIDWRNHGTAVLGEFGGDAQRDRHHGHLRPTRYVSGDLASRQHSGSAAAIHAGGEPRSAPATSSCIELHRPGPRFNFATRDDQRGYIAVEWWPDDFAAIRYATSKGVIVVEAAGNGAENLDDALYDTPAGGLPAGVDEPVQPRRTATRARSSSAPARRRPGTHGRDHGPDRSRLDFSNWGALIDAQGWGREVTTCGYGDLQGGANEDLWYTDTLQRHVERVADRRRARSPASRACARRAGAPVLTPAQVRNCLRHRLAAAGRAGPAGDAANRQPPRSPALSTARVRQGQGARQGSHQGDEGALQGTKDSKDSKERKEVAKEQVKEQLKEQIKEQLKDIKEKELKEGKELKEKELKEVKEFKEGKEIKEKDKDFEGKPTDKLGEVGGQFGVQPAAVPIEQRLGALEQAVQQLVHFIGQELRPDLSRSALQTSGQAAKDEKDLKDAEKTSDA